MQIVYAGPMRETSFQGIVCQRYEPVSFPNHIALLALEQDCWLDPSDPSVMRVEHEDTGEVEYRTVERAEGTATVLTGSELTSTTDDEGEDK
jgi:hypothetical protein